MWLPVSKTRSKARREGFGLPYLYYPSVISTGGKLAVPCWVTFECLLYLQNTTLDKLDMSAYSNQQNYDNPNYPSYPQQSGSGIYGQGQGSYGGQPYGGQPYGGQPYGGQPYGGQAPAYSVPIQTEGGKWSSGQPDQSGQPGMSGFDEKSVRLGFIRKVYSILMCQLLVTGGIMALFMYVHTIKR